MIDHPPASRARSTVPQRARITESLLRVLLAVTLTAASLQAAQAMPIDQDCQPEDLAPVDAWLTKHPFANGKTSPDTLVTAACKPSSRDPSLTILAAAYTQASQEPSDKNAVVALVDTRTHAVRSAFKGTIAEDAMVRLGNLHLDTAPYDLAPGVRAFGVDVQSAADSPPCAEGWAGPWRTLFVQDGAALRPVLEGFVLSRWILPAGNPACGSGDAAPTVETTRATIAIGPRGAKGLADLVVTESTDSGPGSRAERTARYVLHYDGTRYRSSEHPGDTMIVPETAPPKR
jgi:hypothetical protein